MSDEDFMGLALEEAKLTLAERCFPVGAVLVSNGEVLGKGRKQILDFYMGHAEMQVLHQVMKQKKFTKDDNLVLYTTIEPCAMCFGAILHCPITRVVYALEDTWGGATKIDRTSLPTRHQRRYPEIEGGILREESRILAKQFINQTDDRFWRDQDNVFVKLILE